MPEALRAPICAQPALDCLLFEMTLSSIPSRRNVRPSFLFTPTLRLLLWNVLIAAFRANGVRVVYGGKTAIATPEAASRMGLRKMLLNSTQTRRRQRSYGYMTSSP
ncbi:MAG: hypothetical protein QM744_12475 [Mesorhizobium sp.]